MDTAMRHRVNAARVAVRSQLEFFNRQLGEVASEWKADDTRVTFADFAVSETILNELQRSFPEDQFFSEESGPMDEVVPLESRYAWILDPIDGTNNYALGISLCAISLCLLKKGQPVYGLVYDGSRHELIEGGPSTGLRVNGTSFRPREPQGSPGSRLLALHFPLPEGRSRQLAPLLESTRVRSLGSAALHLAYVALGRLDVVLDEQVRPWDIAGSVALLEASGRSIHYLSDNPFPVRSFSRQGACVRYLAGSGELFQQVQNLLG